MNGPKGGSDRWRYRELGSCMLVFLMGELVLTDKYRVIESCDNNNSNAGKDACYFC